MSRISLVHSQPWFTVDGTASYFISRNDIYVVASSWNRRGPSIMALDFLTRLYELISTLCRISPPDSLDAKRLLKHQILVMEILDEVVANGQMQVTSPDKIKNLIYRFVLAFPTLLYVRGL